MVRDPYDVRPLPAEDPQVTPLSDEEEQRFRAILFSGLGNGIADRGRARFPAYAPQDRRRPVDVADRLTAHRGRRVLVEAEDECRLRLRLAGHATGAAARHGATDPVAP
ncbi:hypothetical protein GCM10010415_71470 [Streptomyces atrovirens]|uniref:Uncharacterized protein n=1 Tax=Streptomyces atrovirens TaxID=285556 RepID=A0ABW0DYG2_9ACTN